MKQSKALSFQVGSVSRRSMDDEDLRREASSAKDLPADPSSLVAEVLDNAPTNSPGRALVRWRTRDGTLHERSVAVVKGLGLETGDLVLLHRSGNWTEWLVAHVIEGRSELRGANQLAYTGTNERKLQVKIADKRIEIEGQDEVVLRCGLASITLRRNGRVVVRGTYVESRSKGTNRIKGGTVQIN